MRCPGAGGGVVTAPLDGAPAASKARSRIYPFLSLKTQAVARGHHSRDVKCNDPSRQEVTSSSSVMDCCSLAIQPLAPISRCCCCCCCRSDTHRHAHTNVHAAGSSLPRSTAICRTSPRPVIKGSQIFHTVACLKSGRMIRPGQLGMCTAAAHRRSRRTLARRPSCLRRHA